MGWTRKSRERNTPQVSEDTFKLTTLTSGFHLFCIPLSCRLHALNVCVDFARLLASKTELCSPPLPSSTLGSTSSKGELRFVPGLYVPAYSIPSAPCSSGTFVADDLSLLECSQRYGGQPRSTGRLGASKALWKVHRLPHPALRTDAGGMTPYT